MNNNQGALIEQFFEIVQKLKHSNIIRSERYLGDIGEYIASNIFNVILSNNKREELIDGKINEQTVQIKFNNSPTKTNINVGQARNYDILILILSKSSLHFPVNCKSDFVAYFVQQEIILQKFSKTAKNTFSCTKKTLETINYSEINYFDLK
jgi:hypothetical protein